MPLKKWMVISAIAAPIGVALIFAGLAFVAPSLLMKAPADMTTASRFTNIFKEAVAVCGSETLCIDQLNATIALMNRTVDPCVDFYAYACGNSDRSMTQIGIGEKSKENELTKLAKKAFLRILLDNGAESEWEAERKVRAYYKSCIDASNREKSERFLMEIVDAMGGFSSNRRGALTLQEQIERISYYNPNHLFRIHIPERSSLSSFTNNLVIDFGIFDEASPGVKHFDGRKQERFPYLERLKEVSQLLDGPNEDALKEMIDFERKLYYGSADLKGEYFEFQVSRLDKCCPLFNWTAIISEFTRQIGFSKKNIFNRIDKRGIEKIHVKSSLCNKLTKMCNLISKMMESHEGRDLMMDYLTLKAVLGPYSLLPKPAGSSGNGFQCLKEIYQVMPLAVESLFKRQFFPKAMFGARHIFEQLMMHFMAITKGLAFSAADRVELAEKIDDYFNTRDSLKTEPPDAATLNSIYGHLNVFEDEYLANRLVFAAAVLKNRLDAIYSTESKFVTKSPSLKIAAAHGGYLPLELSQIFVAHQLGAVAVAQYGALFGESFSPIPLPIEEYSNCVQNFYSDLGDFYGKQLDESVTARNDASDVIILQLTYQLYQREISDRKFDELFFITYAQSFCSSAERKYFSPVAFRVRGAITNSPEFINAFQCRSKGIFQNLTSFCPVWRA